MRRRCPGRKKARWLGHLFPEPPSGRHPSARTLWAPGAQGDSELLRIDWRGPSAATGPGCNGAGPLVLATMGYDGAGDAAMTEFTPITTPEPASLALMLGGLSVLGLAGLRKRGLAPLL